MQIKSVLSHEELNRFVQNWAAPLKLPFEVTPNIRIARYDEFIVVETISSRTRLGFFRPDSGLIHTTEGTRYYPIINFINELNYCGYTNRKDVFFDRFVNGKGEELQWLNLYYEQAYPATKEQREKLEKAIHEAGYEWDAEKKELKKIEQNPAWSEEDEKKRKRIMHSLSLDGTINNKDLADINDWLKSLKERYTWKPSDEQMKELDEVIRNPYLSTAEYNGLIALGEQLKAL